MKKTIGFLTIILLAVTAIFSGCGKVQSTFEINWNIDLNNKIELNPLFQNSGTSDSNFNDQSKYIIKAFEEGTGYKVNYTQLPASGADQIVSNHIQNREQFNLMKLTRAQFEMNVFDGAFLPLNDLLDKWGPTIKEKVKPSAWSSVTIDENIYAIPEVGFGYMQDFALVCRTDMFQQAGITDDGTSTGNVVLPQTIDEFETALYKLNSVYGGDPQYNALGYSGSTTIVKSVATALNLPARYYEDENGEIKHYIESPEMLDYLNTMGDWVSKGYSANSFVTTTQQDVMSNLASGKISIGYLPYWYMNPLYSIMEANGIQNSEAVIDWVLNLKNDEGEYSYLSDEEVSYYIVIPFYMAENSGYAIDWIDKKMTDELWTDMSIGQEGVHYNIVDGEIVRTDKFDEVLENSFYLTGGNKDVSRLCWLTREQVFNCWPVLISAEDEEKYVKTTALNGASPFKNFCKLRERGESFMLGNFQNIISQNKGQAGWQSAINVWKAKTWTTVVSNEVNEWYTNKTVS
jgi:putative aldouronate transport system substrate-binding protein